jgi:uncharacterized membrane protein YbhN (UPF0104 family)
MVGFYFIGMYFNLLLPTSVGGDVVRAWYLDGQSGKKLLAFLSSFLDRLCGLYVLLAIACVGVLISPQPLPDWMVASVWSLAAGGLASLALLPILLRYRDRAPGRLGRILTALHSLPSLRILAWPVLLSVVVQVGNVVLVWMIGEAIAAPVPVTFYWVLVPLVSLLTLLPISVNGMGVREGAMTVLLASVGVGQGTALTLSFLWFAVSATVSLAGGLVYMFGRFPRPQLATALTEEVEQQHGLICCHSDQGRTGQPKAVA